MNLPTRSARRVRTVAPLFFVLFGLGGAACGDRPPALQVGEVAFSSDELVGIPSERRLRLAELTALGLAVAREELANVGAPLLERRREEVVLERFRAHLALDAADVGEDALRAHYATNPRLELLVRHVVALADPTAPEEDQEAARATARTALERVEAGEPFEEVAAELSEEPGAAERGGLLRPGREGSWVQEFWDAARALEPGEVSEVVRTPFGFHVLELEERRRVPFEDVRHEVALEAARLLGTREGAWEAWTTEIREAVEVDREAVRAWLACSSIEEQRSLVRAPEGPLLADEAERAFATRSAREVEEILRDTDGAVAFVIEEAVRSTALARAGAREIEPPPGTEERLVREWEGEALQWAGPLGFQSGHSTAMVHGRALEALSSTGQNARVARNEVAERGALFRAAYPVGGTELPPRLSSRSRCEPEPDGA